MDKLEDSIKSLTGVGEIQVTNISTINNNEMK